MARNLSKTMKRFVAGVCALTVLSGAIPVQPVADLINESIIAAKAEGDESQQQSTAVTFTKITSTETAIPTLTIAPVTANDLVSFFADKAANKWVIYGAKFENNASVYLINRYDSQHDSIASGQRLWSDIQSFTEGGGSVYYIEAKGTASNPYQIYTAADLETYISKSNGQYVYSGENIALANNITGLTNFYCERSCTIALNDKEFTANNLVISSGADLTLAGPGTVNAESLVVNENATVTLDNDATVNIAADSGANIEFNSSSRFIINGGSTVNITNTDGTEETADDTKGTFISAGILNLNNGTINANVTNNSAQGSFKIFNDSEVNGDVTNSGEFFMEGGTVNGEVTNSKTATMIGGKIKGRVINYGNGSTFTMGDTEVESSPEIQLAGSDTIAVNNEYGSTFTLNSGTITGTVYDDGEFEMNGGTVQKLNAYSGATVEVGGNAKFTLNKGTIKDKVQNDGTFIMNDGSLLLSGGSNPDSLFNNGTGTGATATINGGTVAGKVWSVYTKGVTITGGTFNNNSSNALDRLDGGEFAITGGTFAKTRLRTLIA